LLSFFGIFSDPLVYIFSSFGMLYQEKSGNPALYQHEFRLIC
jgi:hypothetical protein